MIDNASKKNIIHVMFPDEKVISYVLITNRTTTVDEILRRVFDEWNAGSGKECELFLNSMGRSLCVNDIVGVNGKYYQCKSVGWEEVSVKYVNDLEKAVATHPKRFSLNGGAWFALLDVMRQRKNTVTV